MTLHPKHLGTVIGDTYVDAKTGISYPLWKPKTKRTKRLVAVCDAETDPFAHEATIEPFIWGFYDGERYLEFTDTREFVNFVKPQKLLLYAHNGGKFDWMFLLQFVNDSRVQIINGRWISMNLGNTELRDSLAIVPLSLKKFEGKKEIKHWKLAKENRKQHWQEIREYLHADCTTLYEVVTRSRALTGKRSTIASNAMAYCKKLGIDPGKTSNGFDERFRPFYFGGRVQFQFGTYDGGKIIDVRSAYPFAMCHDHATGTDFIDADSLRGLSREQIGRSFITLECFSNGAFPLRDETTHGLLFPIGYGEYKITGWEFLAAHDLRLLSDVRITSVRYTAATINFRPYVDEWFKLKRNSLKSSVDYIIAKIMLNSLYGKLSENPANYKDYIVAPAGQGVDWDNGWELAGSFPGHEIHCRDVLWRYQHDEHGNETEDWRGWRLYKNVATGASITGFTRAHWLRAAHAVGIDHVLYGDTDSLILDRYADLSRLDLSDNLGAWEVEEPCFKVAHIVRKKLYAVQLSTIDPETGKLGIKIASKGSRLKFSDFPPLMAGKEILWKSESPTYALDGSPSYLKRIIRAADAPRTRIRNRNQED